MSTPIRANPNRMELMRLGRRLSLARRGHRLLKDKQDELMERFTEAIKDVRRVREELENLYSDLRESYMAVTYNSGSSALRSYSLRPPIQAEFSGNYVRLMNLRIPEVHVEFEDRTDDLGPLNLSGAFPGFLKEFRKVGELSVSLLNAERKMFVIAGELQKVRRRVNALEHIFMPRLRETINYITMQLEEMERENITRLMKVKDIVRKNK